MKEKNNYPEVYNVPCDEKNQQKSNMRLFLTMLLLSVAAVAMTFLLWGGWFAIRPDNRTERYDLYDIEMISELTTLECRYHNVAVYDIEGGFLGAGRKYVWFEYDVIIKVGIDMNQVRIEKPTGDGIVRIYLPQAEILSASVDKETISKPVCELALGTKLTTEEEWLIVNEGVEKLRKDERTKDIIAQADSSAREILEKHIITIGRLEGKEYKVEWVNNPNDIQPAADDQTTPTAG
ncbi:MAG: DUF4230 domain-containing protein [Oscillospiraceae bacterium]|nr:DUF4230 domain-containing protein [Oscillospiraceae bacterium]